MLRVLVLRSPEYSNCEENPKIEERDCVRKMPTYFCVLIVFQNFGTLEILLS